MNASAALPARKSAPPSTIRGLLEGPAFRDAVSKALPRHLPPERFIRVALTALMRTPKLAECDQASFFQALLSLSQLGLEPDGRRAHLIPFENRKRGVVECQLIVDYKGLVDLAMRSGAISNIHADVVCENDEFEYDRGILVHHRIDFRQERGRMYAAYALVRFKDEGEKADVMTRLEVEAIRERSRAKDNGPWVTDFNEMAKKTVFRRLSKWLPLSAEFRDALEADADSTEDRRFEVAKPVFEAQTFLPAAVEPRAVDRSVSASASPAAAGPDRLPDEPPDDVPLDPPPPRPPPATDEPPLGPRDVLERLMAEAGITFAQLQHKLVALAWEPDVDSYPSLIDLPMKSVSRILRNWPALLKQLTKPAVA